MYKSRRRGFPNLFQLILLGALAGVIFVVYESANTPMTEPIIPPTFAAALGDQATPEAPTAQPTAAPTPVTGIISDAELFIPSAGVSAAIIPVFLDRESWNVSQLGRNIGHLQGTADLHSQGNIVLSGHVEMVDGRRGIFADLNNVSAGDRVILRYQGNERQYQVVELKTVDPNDLTPLYPTTEERLTLITCDEYDFFQDTYHKRIVVVAERVG